MGSVKKKVNKVFNKVADKLIPKELAPILPYASMLLPFFAGPLGGIMSSTIGRYAVPQLLTALSTAKQTGEVDPMQQLITAGTSYLAGGPKVGNSSLNTAGNAATPMEAAYLKANPTAGLPPAGSIPPGVNAANVQNFANIDPDALAKFAKTYKPTFVEGASNFGQGLQRAAQGDLGFGKQALTLGSSLGTGLTADLGNKAIIKQKNKDKERRAGISNYRDASNALSDYYANMVGDYDRMYGGLDFGKRFLNDGGSVKELPNEGLEVLNKVAPEVVDRMGFEDGGTAVSPERFKELVQFAIEDGYGIAEAFEYARRTAAGETQLNQGGRVGMNSGGMSELLDNALGGKDVSGLNKLALLDALSNFKGSEGVMSLLGPLLGMNQGGRVGMNMGGMGSIPQTPTVPKGMQLDGRGGGFIPMGAQEKKDDVPAMLAKNEFVMTSDAVKAAGGGSIEKGAQRMYDVMNNLEAQV